MAERWAPDGAVPASMLHPKLRLVERAVEVRSITASAKLRGPGWTLDTAIAAFRQVRPGALSNTCDAEPVATWPEDPMAERG